MDRPAHSNHANPPVDADPLPAGIQQVLALFQGELAGVEFPEVGAEVLARAVDERQARAGEAAAARAAATAAELALAQSTQALQRLAERAVAYAKVYAADNPELAQELASIQLDAGRRAAKRGRKPTPSQPESSAAQAPPSETVEHRAKSARTPSPKRSAADAQRRAAPSQVLGAR